MTEGILPARGVIPSSARLEVYSMTLLLILLAPTWVTFYPTWMEQRSHGFLVFAYLGWFLYSTRHQRKRDRSLALQSVIAAVLLSIVWMAAMIIGARVVHQAASVALVACAIVLHSGRQGLRDVSSLWYIAPLALPIWEVLTPILQSMTVAVNHVLIRAASIPAGLAGNLIHFPNGTIEVAQSCAGLGFFMSAFAISAVYAHHFLRTPRARVVAIGSALILALISNWLRVFGLIVLGYVSKMQSPLIADHGTYGWIIFACVMFIFFSLTSRIERLEKTAWTEEHSPLVDETHLASMDQKATRHYGWGLSVIPILPVSLWYTLWLIPGDIALPQPTPGVLTPVGWRVDLVPAGDSAASQLWKPGLVGEDFRYIEVRRPAASAHLEHVQIDRFGYRTSRQGHELIGYGNSVAEPDSIIDERTVGPLDNRLRVVRQLIVRVGGQARLVWYWYRVASVDTASPARAKLLELVSFFQRAVPSELIAVSAPCDRTNCSKAMESVHYVVTGRPLNAVP